MKRIALFILLLIAAVAIKAQVSTQNYVRTRTMLNSTGNSYVDDIAYYDGLGRPFEFVQKVAKNGIKTGSPMATLQEYDALGRETNTWLPIKTTTDYLTPATFKSNAPGNYNNDAYPYSQTSYDDSPLNRINTLYGPGNAWRNGWHTIDLDHTFNSASSPLHCIKYSVNSTGGLVKAGNYAAGLLHVVKTTDEDDNVSYTFTDEQGHVLLERRMNGKEPHDTYYVYNDLGNLCFVLQPMYQESGSLEKHAFQYQYDNLNRCVRKVLPGCQYIEYVYDNADRMTFSQDGNQRTKGLWTYYLYDKLGRLTEQGECVDKNTSSGGKTVLVKNHYDNYNFVGSNGFTNTYFTKDTSGYGKGRLTGCEMSVLGSTAKLYAAYYYNVKGLNIKTVEGNLLGGHDVTTTTYTFTGNPATVTHTHTASGKPSCTETYTYTYDHKDRVSKVEHTLGGTKITLNTLTYDDLGRLQSQSFHGSAANKTTYSYNIRDCLTGISSAKLEQDLWYNNGLFSKKYNGSIGEMTWRAGNETTVRRYTYTYDGLDRLTAANYGEGSDYNKHSFDEQVIGYDKNGNILSLQRYGQTGASAYGLIDNLTFTLDGNRQTRIDDSATAAAYNGDFEFKDGVKQANEYAYDANGNLTKDLNKNISSIQYNCLNLPSAITFADGSTITYTYAADGTKLRVVHKIGSTTTTTDYCGNVVYENSTPKYLLTEEGYVTLADKKYHYFLQDHQGNNRVVVDAAGTVEEVNHYYPFGGTFASTNVQPYKYNGKEYDDKKGLNWYDYGARHYDAATGRFTTQDRFAEKYYAMSPYQYGANNPTNVIDINGDSLYITNPAIIDAIVNGFEKGSNVQMKWNNGILDPNSIKEQAQNSNDFFLKDLYEIASSEKMVEVSLSDVNVYKLNGEIVKEPFRLVVDDDTADLPISAQQWLTFTGASLGKSIRGNTGQTLVPSQTSLSGKSSTNNNIQVIINSLSLLNHRTIGLSHEFGHVILFLRNKPFGHTQPGVDDFVYKQRADIMSKRLGYDY